MTDRSILLVVVIFYFVLINLVAFIMYGIDKVKSKSRGWRVSEFALLFPAVIGGAWGAGLGMMIFRHKTKHLIFKIVVPLSLLVYMGMLIVLIETGMINYIIR